MLLTGATNLESLVSGGVVAVLVTALSRPYLYLFDAVILRPGALGYALAYLGYFLVALVRANLDLAYRVLSPALPIRPGLVEVRTRLESPLARMLLANSITLTPGTLTVDLQGDRLLIHCVYGPDADDAEAAQAMTAGFERYIGGFLR